MRTDAWRKRNAVTQINRQLRELNTIGSLAAHVAAWRMQPWVALAVLMSLSTGCGFSRTNARRQSPFVSETPTVGEVLAVINRNAEQVRSLRANDLDISVNAIPLDGKLAMQKPRRFRMVANSVIGTEADIGSNDDEFWFYVPRAGQQRSVVHCSYENYGRIQTTLPFQPDWVLESLGLSTISPDQQHSIRPGNRGTIELVTPTMTPQGHPATLTTVVARDSGWILERRLDVDSRRVASAKLSRHRTDPAYGVVYPGTIHFSWPEQSVDFSVSLDDVEINPTIPASVAQNLWSLPRVAGADYVDLGANVPRGRPSGRAPAQRPASGTGS